MGLTGATDSEEESFKNHTDMDRFGNAYRYCNRNDRRIRKYSKGEIFIGHKHCYKAMLGCYRAADR